MVRTLTNQDELAQIALENPDKYVRRAAVRRINGEKILIKLQIVMLVQ